MNQDLDNGGQAFGFVHPQYTCDRGEAADISHGGNDGMTLRDYFAAKALQGLLACPCPGFDREKWIDFARDAFILADAMLEARK